jgi:hypothetical protein
MQWLGILIFNVVLAVATWLSKFLVKRFAVLSAVLLVIGMLTAGFIAALKALLAIVTYGMPEVIFQAASWVMPSNADDCLSVYVSARLAHWAYWENRWVLRGKLATGNGMSI